MSEKPHINTLSAEQLTDLFGIGVFDAVETHKKRNRSMLGVMKRKLYRFYPDGKVSLAEVFPKEKHSILLKESQNVNESSHKAKPRKTTSDFNIEATAKKGGTFYGGGRHAKFKVLGGEWTKFSAIQTKYSAIEMSSMTLQDQIYSYFDGEWIQDLEQNETKKQKQGIEGPRKLGRRKASNS